MDVVQLAAETGDSLTGVLTVVGTLAFVAASFVVVEVLDRRPHSVRERAAHERAVLERARRGSAPGLSADVGLDGPAVDVFEGTRPFGFGSDRATTTPGRSLIVSALGVAAVGAVGVLLIPLRATVGQAGIALSLVLVVVVAAATGGRLAAAITSAGAALTFNFVHTEPYYTFHIDHSPDVITSVLMIVVGVLVGAACQRNSDEQRSSDERSVR